MNSNLNLKVIKLVELRICQYFGCLTFIKEDYTTKWKRFQ